MHLETKDSNQLDDMFGRMAEKSTTVWVARVINAQIKYLYCLKMVGPWLGMHTCDIYEFKLYVPTIQEKS